jgi:hypothetical protein
MDSSDKAVAAIDTQYSASHELICHQEQDGLRHITRVPKAMNGKFRRHLGEKVPLCDPKRWKAMWATPLAFSPSGSSPEAL